MCSCEFIVLIISDVFNNLLNHVINPKLELMFGKVKDPLAINGLALNPWPPWVCHGKYQIETQMPFLKIHDLFVYFLKKCIFSYKSGIINEK